MSEKIKKAKVYYSMFHGAGCSFKVENHLGFWYLTIYPPQGRRFKFHQFGEYRVFPLGWLSSSIENYIDMGGWED